MPAIRELENRLGIRFRDRELLMTAVTHSSFVNEYAGSERVHDNERLEYLGDAALGLVSAELLYRKYPHVDEGALTQLRAALVKAETLAALARRLGLGAHLRLGIGEEKSGGRERESTLCSAFEAVIGAIYLDRGMAAATDFLTPLLLDKLNEALASRSHEDARSDLFERRHTRGLQPPAYRVTGSIGPEHALRFTVEVVAGDTVLGSGEGNSKRAAAQAAARQALSRMDG